MTKFITPHATHALLKEIERLEREYPDKRFVWEVREYKKARSLEQNARYWVILTYISEQVADENGRKYSPEVWHEYMKAKFLGKDTVVIDGEPTLIPKTTTKLKVLEFADYMTQVEAWAVDHNVHFYESLQEAS